MIISEGFRTENRNPNAIGVGDFAESARVK